MAGWLAGLSLAHKRAVWAWTFLAVPIVFFVVVRFWPAVYAFSLSLTRWNLVGPKQFIGLDNYNQLLRDPVFWHVLGNTFEYLLLGLPISLALSFIIAFW